LSEPAPKTVIRGVACQTSGHRNQGQTVSPDDENRRPTPSHVPSNRDYDARPIPDRVLAIFLVVLAVALLLGYLFLNKMVEISHQEDCMLGHRGNCATVGSPTPR